MCIDTSVHCQDTVHLFSVHMYMYIHPLYQLPTQLLYNIIVQTIAKTFTCDNYVFVHCSVVHVHKCMLVYVFLCRSRGFIMEGFPQTGEELRYLSSKGLFPDATLVLQVEEQHVVDRLLPGKMEIWRRKRDHRIEKRTATRAKVLQEWVSRPLTIHVLDAP